jgi:calcineurin-like phosphoesterase family protein
VNLRIICCETCEGVGRYECGPYEIDHRDGSVHGHEHECHVCEGAGELQVEVEPITLDDLDAMGAW